jgi:ComF family protein
MNIKDFFNLIKRSIFHERWTCNVCQKEIFSGYFCDDCAKEMVKIGDNKCNHCGRQTPYPVNYCDSCSDKNLSVDVARSVYEYSYPISVVIQNFKYQNARYHAKFFAEKLYEIYKVEKFSVDAVTFVPMSETKLAKRGYNQSKLLADEFSRLSGIETLECVEKVKETESQANLSFSERVKNLKGAFKSDKRLVKDKSVLLIDDVLTTGSTAECVANSLKKAGAKSVLLLTVASVSKF